MTNTFCPVCGYNLGFPSWLEEEPSDEICSSCGTHFGYDDIIRRLGDSVKTDSRYGELRSRWINSGMKWWAKNPQKTQPLLWNPEKQLRNIGVVKITDNPL